MKIDDILDAMSQASELDVERLTENTRRQIVVTCRDLMFLYISNNLEWTTTKIGEVFNRDHSTVLHGIKRAHLFLTTPSYKQERKINDKFLAILQEKKKEEDKKNSDNMIETNDSRDPRLQKEPDLVGFEKKVIVTLSKNMPLHTIYYEEHMDCDGHWYATDESDGTDFLEEFKSEHHSIQELLDILKKEAEGHLKALNNLITYQYNNEAPEHILADKRKTESIIRDCSGWKIEDIYIDDI